MLGATLIEIVVPVGLLFTRTRAVAALVLCGYVLVAGTIAYSTSGSFGPVAIQPLARIIAVAGALLFVFAATQALRESNESHDEH
jgi:putative Ca2+/H+ antiporter (TMEM165/GDT1 family)